MKIAFDKVNISPDCPVRLSGFGKKRWANTIHDELFARVFLFQEEEKEILWVQMDLVGIDDFLFNLIQQSTGIAKENCIISCTHTHSGPVGTLRTDTGILQGTDPIFGEINACYCHKIANAIGTKVNQLRNELSPFVYKLVTGKIQGLGTDRHDPQLPCDEDMLVVEFKSETKKALLIKVACHPTVLNGDNLEVSADFPYAVEKNLSNYAMCALVNGSCGDMSTRFTRQASGFDEVERFGKLVSNQVQALLETTSSYKDDFKIQSYKRTFTLKVKQADPIDVAQMKLKEATQKVAEGKEKGISSTELRLLQSLKEGAENNFLMSQLLSRYQTVDLSIGVIDLAGYWLVTVPVELFSKLSNPLKEKLTNLDYIGYTNGYMLYMVDHEGYQKGYYEAGSSIFEVNEAERLMNEIEQYFTKGYFDDEQFKNH